MRRNHPHVGRRCRALKGFSGPEHGLWLQFRPTSIPHALDLLEMHVREDFVDPQSYCQPIFHGPSQGTFHGAVLLRHVWRSQLAAYPETITVVCKGGPISVFFNLLLFFFHLTHSRWAPTLLSYMWSLTIFPSLPGSRLTNFYRDVSSALLQLVSQRLNLTYSRANAFRYGRQNKNPALTRIEHTTSGLTGLQVIY